MGKLLHNRINKEELKQQMIAKGEDRITLSFYKYHRIVDPYLFRNTLYKDLSDLGVYGRIYVSSEGINAQISIAKNNWIEFDNYLNTYSFFKNMRRNIAVDDDGRSFFMLKIKVKEKIVADGLDDSSFDVSAGAEHIDAQRFNELTDKDDVMVIDMRNHYESEVGHFENAICPDVDTFRDSLPIVEDILAEHREKSFIFYCTGGIRCEKATAYFRHKGFKKVYQLDGGIIEYARQVKERGLSNKYIGKNFVFDERMGERISADVIAHCHQCGNPSDQHVNCANDQCHILFIQCDTCEESYSGCCSKLCTDFMKLSEEERRNLRGKIEFPGTRAGKSRYRHG